MSSNSATSWSTSSDLLTLVRQRDSEAWRRFVALYAPLIYGWCRTAGISAADSADVMQEVFVTVNTAINDFRHDRPGDTLRGWLRVICRNKLTDYFRRNGGVPRAAGGTDAALFLAALAETPEDASTADAEQHALVRQAAELARGEFEPQTWQAFWLIAVERRTAADAGEQLGLTIGAVRQAKYMVLRRLRELLSGDVP